LVNRPEKIILSLEYIIIIDVDGDLIIH
jgi:hypothetical protein